MSEQADQSPTDQQPRLSISMLTAVRDQEETRLVATITEADSGLSVAARCAGLSELLAAAQAGRGMAALVGADLDGLDSEVVAELGRVGLAVIGVPREDRPQADRDRLRAWGIEVVARADSDAATLRRLAILANRASGAPAGLAASRPAGAGTIPGQGSGRVSERLPEPDTAAPGASQDRPQPPAPASAREPGKPRIPLQGNGSDTPAGRMVAVWGPVGAPGRSTVAVHLASVLAAGGQDTLLVDADSYGASVAHLLGILDDAPGLAAACRSSVGGQLRADVLARIAVTAADRLRVLTGIPDAARWPEITAAGLSSLWPAARALSAWTVVDTAAVIEEDEELSYDTRAPRRNMAALSALRAADEVVVVGRADPLGLARLIRGLDQLRTAVPGCAPVVVLTGARRSALGPGFTRSARALLGTHAAVHEPVVIPDDRQALDAALLAGRPAGSKSATVQAMTELLARITADSGPAAAPAARRRIVARR